MNPRDASSRERPSKGSLCIADQIDPEIPASNGINTIVRGFVKYGDAATDVRIIGVTSRSDRALGRWRVLHLEGRSVSFLPVARTPRPESLLGRLPESMLFAAGLLRFRRMLPQGTYQAHRIETGWILRLMQLGPVAQFLHNSGPNISSDVSESMWNRIRWVHSRIERSALRHARSVTAFCVEDVPRLREIRPDVLIAQTWYDPEVFYPPQSPRVSEDGAVRIAWVGRLEQSKDPLLAVDVIEELRSRGIGASLDIIGDGSLADVVSERIVTAGLKDVVRLHGSLSPTRVADALRSSDVLLMTSYFEGSPTVQVEANAVGIPVVATGGADPEHALDSSLNGFRAEGRSVSDLADGVVLVRSLGEAGCVSRSSARAAPAAARGILARSLGTGADT